MARILMIFRLSLSCSHVRSILAAGRSSSNAWSYANNIFWLLKIQKL